MECGNGILPVVRQGTRGAIIASVIFFTVFSCSVTHACTLEKAIIVSPFCEHVHARTYFILRVKKGMQFLRYYTKNNTIPLTHISVDMLNEKIHHVSVRSAMHDYIETQSIKPLLHVWDDIASYRSLDDYELTREFGCILVLLMAHIIERERFGDPCMVDTIPAIYDTLWTFSPEDQFNYLCYYLACLTGNKDGCFYQEYMQDQWGDTKSGESVGGGYTESITCRLYYQKRLTRMYKVIEYSARNTVALGVTYTNVTLAFSHPRIRACMQAIEEQQSLGPLMELWDEFKEYHFINDDLFLKEFLIATVVVVNLMKNSLAPHVPSEKLGSLPDFLFRMYDKIYALPLEEILSTIDLLAEELPTMIQTYRPDCSLGWSAWVRKYFWSMPIDCMRVGIKVLLKFKDYMRPPLNQMFMPMPLYDNAMMQQVPLRNQERNSLYVRLMQLHVSQKSALQER